MDHYELGVALAGERIAELRRQADWWRLASRRPDPTARRHRDRPPGSLRLAGRHGQAAASGPGRAGARGCTQGRTARVNWAHLVVGGGKGIFPAHRARRPLRLVGSQATYAPAKA